MEVSAGFAFKQKRRIKARPASGRLPARKWLSGWEQINYVGGGIALLNDPLLVCLGRGKVADGIAHSSKEQQGAFLPCLSQKS